MNRFAKTLRRVSGGLVGFRLNCAWCDVAFVPKLRRNRQAGHDRLNASRNLRDGCPGLAHSRLRSSRTRAAVVTLSRSHASAAR